MSTITRRVLGVTVRAISTASQQVRTPSFPCVEAHAVRASKIAAAVVNPAQSPPPFIFNASENQRQPRHLCRPHPSCLRPQVVQNQPTHVLVRRRTTYITVPPPYHSPTLLLSLLSSSPTRHGGSSHPQRIMSSSCSLAFPLPHMPQPHHLTLPLDGGRNS